MPENTVRIDRHMPGIWLDRLVTQKVTETLNAMLDTEAGELVRASRYEPFRRPEDVSCTGTPTCSGLAARWRKRAGHRSLDGHDQKCATFRALPGLWALFAYGPPHPALYEKVRDGKYHERKGGGREAREKL